MTPALPPGSVFVALRPDNTSVDVRLLAEAIIEEADKVGGAAIMLRRGPGRKRLSLK